MEQLQWFVVIMLADLSAKVICKVAYAIDQRYKVVKRISKPFKKKTSRKRKLAQVIALKNAN
jgi:hypothetical protein